LDFVKDVESAIRQFIALFILCPYDTLDSVLRGKDRNAILTLAHDVALGDGHLALKEPARVQIRGISACPLGLCVSVIDVVCEIMQLLFVSQVL
jgi:hypothetical protein